MTKRRRVSYLAGAALTVLALVGSGAMPAVAAADSWWRDVYDIDGLHAQGFTGKGVKIAMIDSQINANLPAFSDRDLSVSEPAVCGDRPVTTDEAQSHSIHGTTLAAMLIGNGTESVGIKGIVPDASLRFYGVGDQPPTESCTRQEGYDSDFAAAVQRAVDDGAQIITTSLEWGKRDEDINAVAYAMARNVPIVISTTNAGDGEPDTQTVSSALNGIVAVAAIDQRGYLQSTDDGQVHIVPFTTVVAPGVNLPTLGRNGSWDGSSSASGSSFAAPLVAGMLAMELQKYPGSTANQLIQALIRSTDGTVHDPVLSSTGLGYGTAVPSSLLTVDPRQLPDENPLMQKVPGEGPTAEQIAYAGETGSVNPPPRNSLGGTDLEEPAAAPDALGSAVIVVVVALVLVVIGGIATLIIILTHRRKRGTT